MITLEELKTKVYSRAMREKECGCFGYHILMLNFEGGEYTSIPQFKESLKLTIKTYQEEFKNLSEKPCERTSLENTLMDVYGKVLEQFYSLWEECLK